MFSFVIPAISLNCSFALGSVLTKSKTSCVVSSNSILDSLISVTSCVNCSPNTLFDASIALAGKNLFIYPDKGTPLSGL